jgi:hypothetical protein
VDDVPKPVQVDVGLHAVVLEERDGDPRDGSGFEVREDALKDVEATDADDSLDLPALDKLEDDRGALCDEHGIAEALGLLLEILDRAKPAFLAKQAELVKRGRAALFVAQAYREEQEPFVVGDRSQDILPRLIVDQDGSEIPGVFQAHPLCHDIGVLTEFFERDGRGKVVFRDILGHLLLEAVPFETGLGDIGLRFSPRPPG